jgi:hypothetical protein
MYGELVINPSDLEMPIVSVKLIRIILENLRKKAA